MTVGGPSPLKKISTVVSTASSPSQIPAPVASSPSPAVRLPAARNLVRDRRGDLQIFDPTLDIVRLGLAAEEGGRAVFQVAVR